jgi:hypothetical protein
MAEYAKILLVPAVLLTIFIQGGCSDSGTAEENRALYLEIKEDAKDLYAFLHPLRSSRLGIASADSSLFTFSEKELSTAKGRIEELMSQFSELTAENLSEEELDNSHLIISWLHGEELALAEIRYFTKPVIYSWAAREALWGLPSRRTNPGEGEFAVYRKRLGRLPALFNSGRERIEKPSTVHIEISLEIIDRTRGEMRSLLELLSARYGAGGTELERALEEINRFRKFITDTLSSRATGRIILGTENLTGIFEYDESITSDSDYLISRAGERVKVLRKNLEGFASGVARGAGENPADPEKHFSIGDIREIAAELLEKRGKFTGKGGRIPPMVTQRGATYPDGNPFFFIPFGEKFLIDWIPGQPGGSDTGALSVSQELLSGRNGNRRFSESRVTFELIRALALARCCRPRSDTLRAMIGGSTYRYAGMMRGIDEYLKGYTGGGFHLRKRYIRRQLLNFARMIAVFRLHEGRFTIEAATDFFVEQAGITEEQAMFYIREAYISPSAAYPGIADILISDIRSKLAKSGEEKLQGVRVDDLLRENRLLPLEYIQRKYF